jgi:hypothetical protein
MRSIQQIFQGEHLFDPWQGYIYWFEAVDCPSLLVTFDEYRQSIPRAPAAGDASAQQAYDVFQLGITTFEEPVIGWIEGCRADPTPRNRDDFTYQLVSAKTNQAVQYLSEAVRILEGG